MGVTISTHNGSSVARDHNIRNQNITDKESHIDPNGVYEIWHDERLTDAYHRLFDGAVKRYNEKQRRADRRIENYLAAIQKDAAKKPVYEMIIGVYGADCTDDTKREILREFVVGWKERNPNLEMIGAYYHADEESQDPHVHIDYIPVAQGYRRGMDTQNGLVKALEEQGIESGKTMKETAQIKWEKRENEHLERLCVARGLTVDRPGKGKKHLDTPEYKALMDELQEARQQLRDGLQEVQKVSRVVRGRQEELEDLDEEVAVRKAMIDGYEGQIGELQDAHHQAEESLGRKQAQLQKVVGGLQEACEGIQKLQKKLDETRREANILRAEKMALTTSVADLRTSKDVLLEEIAVLQEAIKEKSSTGAQRFGAAEWQRRIVEAKENRKKEDRLDLLERFVAHPLVAPLWERLRPILEKERPGKKKERREPSGKEDR